MCCCGPHLEPEVFEALSPGGSEDEEVFLKIFSPIFHPSGLLIPTLCLVGRGTLHWERIPVSNLSPLTVGRRC